MTLRVAALIFFAFGLAACSSTRLVEATPYRQDVELALPAARVFDALVAVISATSLHMTTVSKDSGVLEAAPMAVSADDMDRFCNFPAHDSDGKPISTFAEYKHEEASEDNPAGDGSVQLSFLVKTLTPESCSVSVTADWTTHYDEHTVACVSKGVLEGQLIDKLKTQLLTPAK